MSHSTVNHLALQEKTRREILHKGDLIPPLPDLVVRLLGLLNDKEAEPKHLEDLLQHDQVLVAKMLAMVNSPFYGLNRTIRTIKEAVMVLGFRGVRSLVLATSTARFLQRDYSCYGHTPKGLWLHAVSVAAGARALARSCRLGQDEAEQLFVGGLLHDIGKLLLVPYLTDAARGQYSTGPVVDYERARVGIDHAEAGGLVAVKWNLAAEVQQVIGAHHAAAAADTPSSVAVVRLADAVAHETGVGYLPQRAPAVPVQPADVAALGLDEASWSQLRDEIAVTMDEAVLALGNLS